MAVPAMSAVEKSLKSIARARSIASSIKGGRDAYKSVLLCRLEVQYSLYMLRSNFQLETPPPKLKRAKISADLLFEQICGFLSRCEIFMKEGKVDEAFAELLSADLLLGRAIPIIRKISKTD
jgi:hypothetical protein